MEVTFWGTRGSIPVSGSKYAEFGGNTPCLQISLESTTDTVIFDSGSGVRELGVRLIQTRATHELLERFDECYQRVKHQHKALTFADLTVALAQACLLYTSPSPRD